MSKSARSRELARELISVDQFAAECGVGPRTVRNWIRTGQVPAYRLSVGRGLIRLDRRDVDLVLRRARPEEVSP